MIALDYILSNYQCQNTRKVHKERAVLKAYTPTRRIENPAKET